MPRFSRTSSPAPSRPIEALEARTLLATVPTGFVADTAVSGLSGATSMVVLPDGRWLVTEQAGRLRVVENGALLPTPALTVATENRSERGLLGVEIDPNFPTNNYVYLYYTNADAEGPTKSNRVSRFTLAGNTAAPNSEQVLLELSPLSTAGNHNGGAMHFGPDGKLYVATGENATPTRSQDLTNLHGKMLRINADGTIPTNPFDAETTGKNKAIWAYGLRNPYTFAFHPTSGRMHINDVGQDTWEEINVGRAGANYGWPTSEGPTTDPRFDAPVHYYGRDVGEVITGGTFYAGATQQFPASYKDDYFFADFDGAFIKVLDSATNQRYDFATGTSFVTDLDLAADGSLLYLSYTGTIGRISYVAGADSLSITSQPADLTRFVGQSATFTVSTTSNLPVNYQWFRGDQPIDGATASQYVLNSVTADDDDALFHVEVSNAAGTRISRAAKLTVSTTNTAPVPKINKPLAGATFRGGSIILFSGEATDNEEALAGSAYDWTIEYVTGSVVRPFLTFADSTSGSFDIPTETPYTAADVKYRLTLTVTDSQGASRSTSTDLLPLTSRINLSSSGASVPMLLDGQPMASPVSVVGVEFIQRSIEAPASYVVNGVTYTFSKWSDNGARARTIQTPINDLNLVATYVAAPTTPTTGTAQITGYVINDVDADGVWDGNEKGVAGRTVWIDADDDGTLDPGEKTTTTTSNGKYFLTNLPAGRHVVRQVIPSGLRQTKPTGNAAYVVTLTNGQLRAGNDFATAPGDNPPPPPPPPPPPTTGTATLSGYVVNDKNKDGLWNNGELGIAGRQVYLDRNKDGKLDAGDIVQMTASNGKFVFSNVPAGPYVLRQVIPTGWRQTKPTGNGAFTGTLTSGLVLGGRDFATTTV